MSFPPARVASRTIHKQRSCQVHPLSYLTTPFGRHHPLPPTNTHTQTTSRSDMLDAIQAIDEHGGVLIYIPDRLSCKRCTYLIADEWVFVFPQRYTITADKDSLHTTNTSWPRKRINGYYVKATHHGELCKASLFCSSYHWMIKWGDILLTWYTAMTTEYNDNVRQLVSIKLLLPQNTIKRR